MQDTGACILYQTLVRMHEAEVLYPASDSCFGD